ncbi:MAG: mechanosensitive ion channel domain-containing protein [Gemmatimonadota bacterium]
MDNLVDVEWFAAFGPSFLFGALTVAVMYGVHQFITTRWDRSVRRDVAATGLQVIVGLSGTLLVILLLPVDQQTRETFLTVGGLVLSAIVGFSSTTVIKDAAAGITLRFIEPFGKGDYLSISELFGRVSDMGFFHVELQTERRSLVTLTYTELLNEPFEVVPASGAILDTSVTLRYDVPRDRVEGALIEAAEACDLKEPFVHIEKLGRVTITYKVAGLLEDIDGLLTAQSSFRTCVLDSLHEHGIVLLSPSFQGKWDYDEGEALIPKLGGAREEGTEASEDGDDGSTGDEEGMARADEIVFDKALKARKIEDFDDLLTEIDGRLDEESGEMSEASRERLEQRREMIEERKKKLEERLAAEEEG